MIKKFFEIYKLLILYIKKFNILKLRTLNGFFSFLIILKVKKMMIFKKGIKYLI